MRRYPSAETSFRKAASSSRRAAQSSQRRSRRGSLASRIGLVPLTAARSSARPASLRRSKSRGSQRAALLVAASVRTAVASPDLSGATDARQTAYLNLEPRQEPLGGESEGVRVLRESGVARVLVGLLHPLSPLRGAAVAALRAAGLSVDVLSPIHAAQSVALSQALSAALRVNEPLLHRAATGLPFSVWKYAMTLDGKIATNSCHSAWITGEQSLVASIGGALKPSLAGPVARERVFVERSRSDAVIIGGRTLRQDNPKLTTRREGHRPARVVFTRMLDVPEASSLAADLACLCF